MIIGGIVIFMSQSWLLIQQIVDLNIWMISIPEIILKLIHMDLWIVVAFTSSCFVLHSIEISYISLYLRCLGLYMIWVQSIYHHFCILFFFLIIQKEVIRRIRVLSKSVLRMKSTLLVNKLDITFINLLVIFIYEPLIYEKFIGIGPTACHLHNIPFF